MSTTRPNASYFVWREAIVGFGVVARLARAELAVVATTTATLVERLWSGVRAIPGVTRNGPADGPRLPNTLNVRFPDAVGSRVLEAAPEVAASTGSACHDGQEQSSAAILAMGISEREALGSVPESALASESMAWAWSCSPR